jgi:hypothetical protein
MLVLPYHGKAYLPYPPFSPVLTYSDNDRFVIPGIAMDLISSIPSRADNDIKNGDAYRAAVMLAEAMPLARPRVKQIDVR